MPSNITRDYLTPHFTLSEMIASDTAAMNGIDNSPSDDQIAALTQTCELLELVRALCDESPVMVSSGFRSSELNAAVGGASNSAHLYGCAADITIPAFGTPLEICRAIEPYVSEWGVDQLIYEQTWVHIGRVIPPSTEPRCQCLTINSAGTFNGIVA
jgi:zinc D-Ala-D-Ala carboxypeptidase